MKNRKEGNYISSNNSIQEHMLMLELRRIINTVRTNAKNNSRGIEHIELRLKKIEEHLKRLNLNLEKVLNALVEARAHDKGRFCSAESKRILH